MKRPKDGLKPVPGHAALGENKLVRPLPPPEVCPGVHMYQAKEENDGKKDVKWVNWEGKPLVLRTLCQSSHSISICIIYNAVQTAAAEEQLEEAEGRPFDIGVNPGARLVFWLELWCWGFNIWLFLCPPSPLLRLKVSSSQFWPLAGLPSTARTTATATTSLSWLFRGRGPGTGGCKSAPGGTAWWGGIIHILIFFMITVAWKQSNRCWKKYIERTDESHKFLTAEKHINVSLKQYETKPTQIISTQTLIGEVTPQMETRVAECLE